MAQLTETRSTGSQEERHKGVLEASLRIFGSYRGRD